MVIPGKFVSMKHLIIVFLSLVVGFTSLRATTPGSQDKFSEKVNLALRQVGHQLLKIAGDEESTVPPVQMHGRGEFSLEMGPAFNYDTLPYLLAQALSDFEIDQDYHVAIRDCFDGEIVLGFNKLSFEKGEVACGGRDLWAECNNIILTIEMPVGPVSRSRSPWISLFLFLVFAAGLGIYRSRKKKAAENPSDASASNLGRFEYDSRNQILSLDGEQQELTFRENKLLNFLATHPNEVITRDTLIEAVWGDEGVIVGRSLDVFISRLRKLLKADDSVQIKTVHGVGYRLEVG